MTVEEYFKDWIKVIDKNETIRIMGWLKTVNPNLLCPNMSDIFKAFEYCSYKDCKVIMLGLDPYPDKFMGKARATGILFGNSNKIPEKNISPSLKVLKNSIINFEIPHNVITFDNTLESWAKQGVLMLNSSLTCELNKVGSHVNEWRPFIGKLLRNISDKMRGIVFVLFGRQAQSFKPYINPSTNFIIESEHPAYFARINRPMPNKMWKEINEYLCQMYGDPIKWYEES